MSRVGLRFRARSVDFGTIWVCRCCMLAHANGECCPDDTHGGDGIAPWSDIDYARFRVLMGLAAEEHGEWCERDQAGECACEFRTFDTSRCEGCGSRLAGERHAFSLDRVQQSFHRPNLPA